MEIKKIAQLTGHQAAVFALATRFETPQYFLSGAGDGWLVAWDLAKPDVGRLVAKVEKNIFSLCFSPVGNVVVVGDMDGGVRFVDLDEPTRTRNIKHHQRGTFAVEVFDNQLFTAGGDGILTRWSAEEMRSIESVQLSNKSLRTMDFSQTRNEIAVGASDGNIYLLDFQTLDVKAVLPKAHDPSVFSIKYTPNGKHLLSGGRDALLKIWHIGILDIGILDNKILPTSSVAAHLFTINAIAFHPTEPTIFATASRDKTIKIWQLTQLKTQNALEATLRATLLKVIDTVRHGCHVRSVNRLLWSPFGNYLLSASDDRSVIVWQIDL